MHASANAEHLLVEVVNPVPLPIIEYPDVGVVMAMAPDVEATAALVERAAKYLKGIARRLDREGAKNVETKVRDRADRRSRDRGRCAGRSAPISWR